MVNSLGTWNHVVSGFFEVFLPLQNSNLIPGLLHVDVYVLVLRLHVAYKNENNYILVHTFFVLSTKYIQGFRFSAVFQSPGNRTVGKIALIEDWFNTKIAILNFWVFKLLLTFYYTHCSIISTVWKKFPQFSVISTVQFYFFPKLKIVTSFHFHCYFLPLFYYF